MVDPMVKKTIPQTTQEIANQLLLYKRAYYQGMPLVSDAEYDTLEDALRNLDPFHPLLGLVGDGMAGSWKHKKPMLSQQKTYEVGALLQFIDKNGPCVLNDKLDGVALSLHYYKTPVSQVLVLLHAVTRGDGTQGEDVTQDISFINSIPKTITIPNNLATDLAIYEIRGELLCFKTEFVQFQSLYEHPRNMVSGILGRKQHATSVLPHLTFVPYDGIAYNTNHIDITETAFLLWTDQQRLWAENHFSTTDWAVLQPHDAINAQIIWEFWDKNQNYDKDGLVCRILSNQVFGEMGATSHHPRGAMAFKQNQQFVETTIQNILCYTNRTGKMNLRAQVDPVYSQGAQIQFATLHNPAFVLLHSLCIGCKVKLTRSGDVIPKIIANLTPPPYFDINTVLPSHCSCGTAFRKEETDYWCDNPACPEKHFDAMLYFIKNIGIEHVSEATLRTLINTGFIKSTIDIFLLTTEQLETLPGFQKKQSRKIIDQIEKAKSVSLVVFLSSLGLPGASQQTCKKIVANLMSALDKNSSASIWDSLWNLTPETMMAWDGFGKVSADKFIQALQENKHSIQELFQYIRVATPEPPGVSITNPSNNTLVGKKICITGTLSKPRQEIVAQIESLGGAVVSSVTSKIFCLLCNDLDATSTKYQQAQKLGIPIRTEQELLS
jgi:DNA ligase (NAD+)